MFYTLPNQGDSMEDAIATLKAHFAPRRNIVVERHAFRKRVPAPGETILQYVAALRDLAATCDFTATLDDCVISWWRTCPVIGFVRDCFWNLN